MNYHISAEGQWFLFSSLTWLQPLAHFSQGKKIKVPPNQWDFAGQQKYKLGFSFIDHERFPLSLNNIYFLWADLFKAVGLCLGWMQWLSKQKYVRTHRSTNILVMILCFPFTLVSRIQQWYVRRGAYFLVNAIKTKTTAARSVSHISLLRRWKCASLAVRSSR